MRPYRLTGALAAALAALGLSAVSRAAPPQPATEAEIQRIARESSVDDAQHQDYGDADFVYLLDESDVYVTSSGLATTESCQLIKVLTPQGARQLCVQRFDFDPATRRVSIRGLRVHRKDATIEDVPVDAHVTQPTVQHMIFWGGQQHVLTIPYLAAGDVIELRTSRTGFNIAYLEGGPVDANGESLQPPMPGHWYEVTLFQGHQPINRKRYSVHLPKDMPVQYEVYNGPLRTSLWFHGENHIYTFSAEDVPAVKGEPHMVALDDCVPKVVMATLPSWQEKSRWFHEVNEGQFAADDAIRETVAQITKGLTSLDDKIAACNHWVADNIRYYGTSRGPCEGFTLHKGIETFHDRGGVCKDKAGMLVTMLRVLGVEAYPALTMAGSRVEDIPADQFNHTVTVMREESGTWRILDPTWIPLSREMWSSREALQGLVYGTAEGEALTLSPYYPPEYNLLACKAESRIDASGGLRTQLRMDLSGYPDTYFRRTLERDARPDMTRVVEDALNLGPTARITDLEYTDPYDYSHDAIVKMQVESPGYAATGDSACLLRLPLMTHPLGNWLIPDMFYDVSPESRTYGMRLRATRRVRYEETVLLPDGWEIVDRPEDRTLNSPVADFAFSATTRGSSLTYTMQLDVKQHLVAPAEYPKYREAIQAMNKIADAWIVCRRPDEANNGPQHAAASAPAGEVSHD